jgi:hypothetical protein
MRPHGPGSPTDPVTGHKRGPVTSVILLSMTDLTPFTPVFERISKLYCTMDRAYSDAAHYYAFHCKGCDHNCCQERFYHYTGAEHIYLAHGLATLGPEARTGIFSRADEVMRLYQLRDASLQGGRAVCPLNLEGFCVLYTFRPMICRLQGIPHHIIKPGHPRKSGPGCHVFNEKILPENLSDFGFDHTPFYLEMAAIEIELRNRLKYKGRYKKTVAEMLVDIRDAENLGLQGSG